LEFTAKHEVHTFPPSSFLSSSSLFLLSSSILPQAFLLLIFCLPPLFPERPLPYTIRKLAAEKKDTKITWINDTWVVPWMDAKSEVAEYITQNYSEASIFIPADR
jgi:hypothetical protein